MAYERTNFHKAVQSHTVLLVNRKTTKTATGVLLDIGVAKLVLTVSHILEKLDSCRLLRDSEDLLVSLRMPNQRSSLTIHRVWQDSNKDIDLAYLQLDDSEVKFLSNNVHPYRIIRRVHQNVVNKSLKYALCGFPVSLASCDDHAKIVTRADALLIRSSLPASEWPQDITNDGKTPQVNFLLKHGSKQGVVFKDPEGNKVETIDPHCLSGAGVWLFDPDSENDVSPPYALYGIQTGWYADYDLLCGTIIDPVIHQIENDYGVQIFAKTESDL